MKEPRKAYAAAVLVILVVAQSILARQQQAPDKQPVDLRRRPKVRAMMRRLISELVNWGSYRLLMTRPKAAFVHRRQEAQLSEDFEKLHSINVEKIAAQSSAPSLDYKTLCDATADLKSRASRIKFSISASSGVDKGGEASIR